MLYFEHNPVETLVGCHDVRGDAFTECVGQGWVDVGKVVDAIASDEPKNGIEKINSDFFVLGTPEKNLEYIVIVDVHELVTFVVFCNASGRVATCFVGFADVLEHCSVLFSIHRAPILLNSGRICTSKNVHS